MKKVRENYIMKDFKKENFDYFGGYLTYEGKFVARFKYRGPITMAKFRNYLIKHFKVEEYFEAAEKSSPLQAIFAKKIPIFKSSCYSPDILFPENV